MATTTAGSGADEGAKPGDTAELLTDLMRTHTQAANSLLGQILPEGGAAAAQVQTQWADVAGRMQALWVDYQMDQIGKASATPAHYTDPTKWIATGEALVRQLPLANPATQQKLWEDSLSLFNNVLGAYGIGPKATETPEAEPELPRSDRRFSDPEWRRQPFFAILHQMYLMLSEQVVDMAGAVEGLEPARKQQLMFATRMMVDALSPANFPLTNPVALKSAAETRGESMVRGMEHLLSDLRRGQLTHTNATAFRLGENIADTPGKVVYETPLFQLIQYTPTTEKVLETPLVIFPPWINRFYILDLNAKKSFVRWAVAQGVSVFMVSWKSADASMADLVWDDYISAQVEAIDVVRDRLNVPSVHTIGYCVAGTTLAATLAMLARKGEADKVASATFFTAQVDFADAGDLKHFIDDQLIDTIAKLAPDGFVDGRYLATTFNLLRGNDLMWNYVEKNYLKGEDYPAFDLLHWNGDVTNLPARWHQDYLRDLYRDNRLVIADSLKVCGVPIDLRRIDTPCYVQAGREDHIAPVESVWKLTHYLGDKWTFVLAGSGHIAGVVNPPSSGKYQYWVNDARPDTLDQFIACATEHPGSWWPHWRGWLESHDASMVPVKGKRRPGGRGDKAIEDAPGRYVKQR
jgi:polyhydroxyalkanoate synthase subunit PhaC